MSAQEKKRQQPPHSTSQYPDSHSHQMPNNHHNRIHIVKFTTCYSQMLQENQTSLLLGTHEDWCSCGTGRHHSSIASHLHQSDPRAASCCLATFVSQQQLESVVWRSNSQNIVSAHNDGSFVVWDAESGEQTEPPNTPYGPYPCKVRPFNP